MKKFLPACFGLAALALAVSCQKPQDVPPPQSEIPEGAVNLSENGTANCYIVAPNATSAFSAEFKGNSTDLPIGNASDARLVWQSSQNLVKEISYAPQSKMIVVETSDMQGNALVAATDPEGKILWSWHLWITDYDPAETDFTTEPNSSGTTWTFMDRNLGALNTNKGDFGSFGMLYQWGRKDPFPAPASFTVMNEDYTYAVDGEPIYYDIDNKPLPKFSELAEYHGTVDKSIANPDVFYAMTKKSTGEYDEYGDEIFVDDPITGDWADVSDDDYWGGESLKKTIYDPCPVGYKVPVCDAGGNSPYEWLTYDKVVWESNGCDFNGVWFPTTGTRAYASGTLDYPEANPYSGLWLGTKGAASSNLEQYPTLYGQYMFIIDGKRMFKVNKDRRSQGLSVRCVKED